MNFRVPLDIWLESDMLLDAQQSKELLIGQADEHNFIIMLANYSLCSQDALKAGSEGLN
jgi:hypothetical protein